MVSLYTAISLDKGVVTYTYLCFGLPKVIGQLYFQSFACRVQNVCTLKFCIVVPVGFDWESPSEQCYNVIVWI